MKTLISGTSPITARIILGESKSAKCRKISNIGIYAGTCLIASTTSGGEYTEEAALKEFKKNKAKFTKTELYAVAESLKLV